MSKPSLRTLVDLAERTGATFAQAFLAAITVGSVTNTGAVKLAGVAGAYAVGKFLLTKANAFLAGAPAAPKPPAPPAV